MPEGPHSFLPDFSIHFESGAYMNIPCLWLNASHFPPVLIMHETSRLLEAAAALSQLLRAGEIRHAFYGNFLTAVLSNARHADEISCIVEGTTHPFRRVRQACAGSGDFTTVLSPWSNRMHATYHRFIPSIDIEILPAGEEGPRHLDATTIMMMGRIPFLNVSEFIRAKLKAWTM
ncbi:hypothetical protein AcW1_001786 [Taiwanofungus camphoratus]|nr:hypothetical protein AcV5_000165 [Antrodia cinnamomea]KAI0944983.1 hypothetical protein AcV7_001640 [Antrodia cinnamomea]KAI0945601.1 hypothetical protein AcW1_001786 [Antrodia cinnamomea]